MWDMSLANPKQDFKNLQKNTPNRDFHDSRFISFCMKPFDSSFFSFFIMIPFRPQPLPDSRGWIDLYRNLWIVAYANRPIYDSYKNRRQAFRPPPFPYYFFLATMRYLWIVPSTFPVSSIILCIFRSFSKHLSTEKPGNSHSII